MFSLLQGRTVCNVTQSHSTNPVVGKITGWRGSVEEEYFTITFIKGVLTISMAEREMLLSQNPLHFAMVEPLAELLERGDSVAVSQGIYDYNTNGQCEKDHKEISFTDVMVPLNWQYKEDAHIDYDELSE